MYTFNTHLVTARLMVIIPFFIIGLTSETHGVSVDGLKLDRLNEKVELRPLNAKTLECKSLNDLLQSATFLETIHEKVSVALSDEVSHESLVDTDDESSIQSGEASEVQSEDVKLGRLSIIKRTMRRKAKLNRSRHVGRATNEETYNSLNNYLSQWPPPVSDTDKLASQSPTHVDKPSTQDLCHQLTSDAFLISESGITDRPGSTTCLCVALRDQVGCIKKFVFHNGENLLVSSMRKKAQTLHYDVIQAEQSHAEGQLIQFLLDRHRKRPGWYTHLLGIGCSRSHCIECDSLLKLYLGRDYHPFTSSIYTKNTPAEGEDHPPDTIKTSICAVNLTTNDEGKLVVNKHIERVADVVYDQHTIDKFAFKKCYLPLDLKDSTQKKLGGIIISFDEERFTRNKKRIQKNP